MSFRQLRYGLEYVVYRLLVAAVRLLPHERTGGVGALLGRTALPFMRRRRRLTLDNLERVFPELSASRRASLASACFAHWGRMFVESVSLYRYDDGELSQLVEFEGLEHLEAAKASGRGLLLTSGHFGAFENATYALGQHVGNVHILVRQQSNPWVNRDITRLRERTGHVLIPRRRAAHRMLNILRRGGTVAIAIDQRVRPTEGVLLPFLGHPAWTGTVPAYLSTITGAPMLPTVALPLQPGHYKIIFKPPIFPGERGEERLLELTHLYLEEVEAQIRSRPEMWFWMHSRWMLCARHRWPESIARLRRQSQLPPRGDDSISRPARRLMESFDHDFLEHGRHAVVNRGTAAGSRAVTALGHALIDSGHPLLYERAADLAEHLAQLDAKNELASAIRKLDRYDLIIIDDLDAAALEPDRRLALAQLYEHRAGSRSLLSIVAGRSEPSSFVAGAATIDLERHLESAQRLGD